MEHDFVGMRNEHSATLEERSSEIERPAGSRAAADIGIERSGLTELLPALMEWIRTTLEADRATILLLSHDGQHLEVANGGTVVEKAWDRAPVPVGQGYAGRIAAAGETWIVEDAAYLGLTDSLDNAVIRSLLGVPLMDNGKAIGVIHVGTFQTRRFSRKDQQLLQLLAQRVAAAIERSNLYERIRADRERLANFSHQLLKIQEEERRHLARELHDEIGQVLTLASLTLHDVKSLVAADAQRRLEDCCQSVDNALDQVRNLSLKLRPSLLDEIGLEAALRWYLHRLAARTGLTAHFDCTPAPGRFHSDLETVCYRVVQEALTNVIRHAQAKQIWVKVELRDARLEISVRDDGVGFDVRTKRQRAARGKSFGLMSMEERVLLVGGTIDIESESLGGTVVCARIPVAGAPVQESS